MQAIQAKVVRLALTDGTIRRLSDKIFDRYDHDCSGHLDQMEVDNAVNDVLAKCRIPAPPGVGHHALKYFDRDHSGTIDREEFFLVVQKAAELAGKKKMYY
mmetsp:Transcript_48238/g.88850  ORF Transcript_48238/g.88850 Transcript_48238/m.88850 type:complete len:101 (+) Transcript_48238:87-389(+)